MRAAIAEVLVEVAEIVGADALDPGVEATGPFAADLFHTGTAPIAVVRPSRTGQVAPTLAALARADVAYAAIGGATSYTAGWLVGDRPWVAIDCRRLDRIVEIDSEALTATVEAGCTWAGLRDRLLPLGLRLPVQGPDSGRHATLGGGLAQDAVFHGSAAQGSVMRHVRALRVARSDGSVVSLRRDDGPALIGAFLADGGALGVKLQATLDLIPVAAAERCVGFRFATLDAAAGALAAVLRHGVVSDAVLLDPAVATAVLGLDVRVALDPGRHAARGAPHLLALALEGVSEQEVAARCAWIDEAVARFGGQADGEGVLAPMRAALFGPPSIIGDRDDGCWVPVHAIVPAQATAAAIRAVEAAAADHRAVIERHGITWSVAALGVGRGSVLVEPGLRWRGRSTPLADRLRADAGLPPARAHDIAETVAALRRALATALAGNGGRHIQHGRFYPSATTSDPATRALLIALREVGDPAALCNPGVLSF